MLIPVKIAYFETSFADFESRGTVNAPLRPQSFRFKEKNTCLIIVYF